MALKKHKSRCTPLGDLPTVSWIRLRVASDFRHIVHGLPTELPGRVPDTTRMPTLARPAAMRIADGSLVTVGRSNGIRQVRNKPISFLQSRWQYDIIIRYR